MPKTSAGRQVEGETKGKEPAGGAPGGDPVGFALAFGAALQHDRVAAKAEAFLEKQAALSDRQLVLVELQAEELRRDNHLHHWSLRVHHISDVLKLAFEIAVAFIVLAIAALIGNAIWDAARDDGLVIEAFSVPPDLAARGLTGEVVAGRVLDKLSAMQAETESMRAASSYTNNWCNDIKVQIPDTGISIGEVNRYLHQWLGHQTRITGDVVRIGSTVSVTARAGADAGETFTGSEGDLDKLLRQAAEALFKRTQPYRYGVYLLEQNKLAEAIAIFATSTSAGPEKERAWAYVGWSNGLSQENLLDAAAEKTKIAESLDPDNVLAWYRGSSFAAGLGRVEAALAEARNGMGAVTGEGGNEIQPQYREMSRFIIAATVADLLGDYRKEIGDISALQSTSGLRIVQEGISYQYADALAEEHDLRAARKLLGHISLTSASTLGQTGQITRDLALQSARYAALLGEYANRDRPGVLATARALDAEEPKLDAKSVADFYQPTQIWPYVAYAEAARGDFRDARRLLDKTPADCDLCLRVRAAIDVLQKDWSGAAWWYSRAAALAPSIPFAWADWGEMLLHKGDYAGAIAKFAAAHEKGPHFADPLEMWGEALMQENRSDLALAKFEEADKYAPNWGRLHLEWGKALFYAGQQEDARKQIKFTTNLDLSPADKAMLDAWARTHG